MTNSVLGCGWGGVGWGGVGEGVRVGVVGWGWGGPGAHRVCVGDNVLGMITRRFGDFSFKSLDMLFQVQTLFGPYLGNGWSDWCETKMKGIGWIMGILCDLDLWLHSWPWPWIFQGHILKLLYLMNCWFHWCEMKRKRINRILGRLYYLALWPHPWPWPWNFKVRVSNSLISGMGWLIEMEWKGFESSIHDHDIDLCVTMVRWVDVPDSDRCNVRCRRSVDMSSLLGFLSVSSWQSLAIQNSLLLSQL